MTEGIPELAALWDIPHSRHFRRDYKTQHIFANGLAHGVR